MNLKDTEATWLLWCLLTLTCWITNKSEGETHIRANSHYRNNVLRKGSGRKRIEERVREEKRKIPEWARVFYREVSRRSDEFFSHGGGQPFPSHQGVKSGAPPANTVKRRIARNWVIHSPGILITHLTVSSRIQVPRWVTPRGPRNPQTLISFATYFLFFYCFFLRNRNLHPACILSFLKQSDTVCSLRTKFYYFFQLTFASFEKHNDYWGQFDELCGD